MGREWTGIENEVERGEELKSCKALGRGLDANLAGVCDGMFHLGYGRGLWSATTWSWDPRHPPRRVISS
jgi:hypothetical protein